MGPSPADSSDALNDLPLGPVSAVTADAELQDVIRQARPGALTATEQRVAELAASGRSNHEIARSLFMSPKTVEWNLSKVYRKLRVHSRTELTAKLAARR